MFATYRIVGFTIIGPEAVDWHGDLPLRVRRTAPAWVKAMMAGLLTITLAGFAVMAHAFADAATVPAGEAKGLPLLALVTVVFVGHMFVVSLRRMEYDVDAGMVAARLGVPLR